MAENIQIVSTKKLAMQQKELLYHNGISTTQEDFIQTKCISFEAKNIHQNLIFTSQNAVQSVLENPKSNGLKTHPVFCVGQKTKQLLEQHGFKVTMDADYASDLAEMIALIHADESFTFFSGNLRRDILPETLKEKGIAFNEIEVYQTTLTPHKIKIKPEGILFFSPSAVESYLKLNKITHETCFCIGETTAESLENNNIKRVVIAEAPSIESVLDDVIEYFRS